MSDNDSVRITKVRPAKYDRDDAELVHGDDRAKLPFVPPVIESFVIGEGLPDDVIAEWSGQPIPRLRIAGDHST